MPLRSRIVLVELLNRCNKGPPALSLDQRLFGAPDDAKFRRARGFTILLAMGDPTALTAVVASLHQCPVQVVKPLR
jgi:hypothetical protein